jgi:DNA excision repair protein ERCC-4
MNFYSMKPHSLHPSRVVTLVTGDYGILGAEHAAAIECKSLDGLVACCGFERGRFKRELIRMRGYPFRRLVVVGARADIEAGRYRSQIKPRAVLASLSAFEVRYDLPIYYFPDPAAAALQVESWCYWIAREIRERADSLRKVCTAS